METCIIEGCSRETYCRSACEACYRRHWKQGRLDELPASRPQPWRGMSREEYFWSRVDKSGECWTWMGPLDDGYGRIRFRDQGMYAHRFAWSLAHGDIPDGMTVDHACHNRRCVNADHLRLATKAENAYNRSGATSSSRLGVRGIRRKGRSYQARVSCRGVKHSATFPDLESAQMWAQAMREELFGEFAGKS